MCNLNQVFGGMQRYHSCCHRKMHHIVGAPSCCGRDRTMPESCELCCPRRVTGISKLPATVRTLASSKVPGKSSLETIHRNPIQTKLSQKGLMGKPVKIQKKAGESVEILKNKGPCINEEDALMSGCSSSCDFDSSNTIFFTKSKRKSQELKPSNCKSEPQNADLKALVRAKPKRKRIVARKWPSRSTECPIEPHTQENNDNDGIWFECNLPFRVNIPLPISMQKLFGLRAFFGKGHTQIGHSKPLVPTRNLTQNGRFGTPFCLTMRNALPAPGSEPESQPSTSKAPTKKGLRRGKNRSCPCETSTQTGEEDPVLCCLEQIRNQLVARSSQGQENTPCRHFAEKSTNVRSLQAQKKDDAKKDTVKTSEEKQEKIIYKPSKIAEESSATSIVSSFSKSSGDIVMKEPSKTKKTGKKPKRTKSLASTTSFQNRSLKCSQKEILKHTAKNKKSEKIPKKTKSITSTKSVKPISSKSSQKEENCYQEKLQKKRKGTGKEEKQKNIKFKPQKIGEESSATSVASSFSKSSKDKEVKSPSKTKKTENKPIKTKSLASTTSVQKRSSKGSQKEILKHPTKNKKPEEKPNKTKSLEKKSSKSSHKEENRFQEKPQKKKIESEAEKPIQSPKPRKNVKEEKSKNKEWINPEPVIRPPVCFGGCPLVFSEYPSAMIPGLEYHPSYMYSYNPMHQPQHYPGCYYQQSWQSWQALEPEMPIFASTQSNNNATSNRYSSPSKGIPSENNSPQLSKSSLDQEPNSQTSKICGQSIMKRVSGECDQGFRDNRCVNNQPFITFRGCAYHSDSSKERNQEDSKTKNSYDVESKYKSSERSSVRRELPSTRDNSKERKSKAEKSSGSKKGVRDTKSLESSKKHLKETIRQSSADTNALENDKKKRNRSPNSETLSRGTKCPRSYGWQNKSKQEHQLNDRKSSAGQTIGSEEFDGMSRFRKCSYDDQFYKESVIAPSKLSPEELANPSQGIDIKSVSGLISKNTISQEYYFPLNDKAPLPIRSHQDVINTNEYQSNSRGSSGNYTYSSRKIAMEPRTMGNISYSQKNSRDTKCEDQTSISLTNRSSSIHCEKVSPCSDENQRKSKNLSESIGTDQKALFQAATLQKVPRMSTEMTSQNSENPLTKAGSLTESTKTEQDKDENPNVSYNSSKEYDSRSIKTEQDIDERPSKSYTSSENFDSRLIYSQFKRQSSDKRFDLNQASENRNNISYDNRERNSRKSNPKDQAIPSLNNRPVNGVDRRSNVSEYLPQVDNCQASVPNNTNQRFVKKKIRSLPASACLALRYKRPFVYCRSSLPKKQSPREYCTLPLTNENVLVIKDETCVSEMDSFPTERIRNQHELDGYGMGHYPLQKGGKDMSDCRTQDYSINYSIIKGNHQMNDERSFISREVQERAPIPRYKPEYRNMHQGSSRNREYLNADYQNRRHNPPMVLVPFRMESREIVNVCQPDEWRELRLHLSTVTPNQLQITPEVRGHLQAGRSQPRKSSTEEDSSVGYHSSLEYHQNTFESPYMTKIYHAKNISKTSFSPSEEEYFPPGRHTFSRRNTAKENTCWKCNQRDISSKKRSILESRQRKPKSYTSLSQSEEGYVSRSPEATRKSHEASVVSVTSSSKSPDSRFNKSVERKGRRTVTGNPSHDSSRSNSHISICRCYKANRNRKTHLSYSGNQTSELSGLTSIDTVVTSAENAQHSISMMPLKSSFSISNTIESDAATNVETLEIVTLMHPRRLRSNESTRITYPDRDTENTVLLEIMTTCKKDNLLQTCGRPPCNFNRQHYTGVGVPPTEVPVESRNYQRSSSPVSQNGNPFEANYLIDPRDNWRTVTAPAPGYQQRPMQSGQRPYQPFPCQSPGCYSEPLWEKIKELPEGFYDQTIKKYNIIRMDSDFQPPPLGSEIIQVLRAQQQCNCGRTGCRYGNPIQRQLMEPFQDSTRPFIIPENQFHPRLPNQPPPFCPPPNVKLDGYDQSESQF